MVGRHVAQLGHLLPAQPAGATTCSAVRPDGLRLQRLPTGTQEVTQRGAVQSLFNEKAFPSIVVRSVAGAGGLIH